MHIVQEAGEAEAGKEASQLAKDSMAREMATLELRQAAPRTSLATGDAQRQRAQLSRQA